MINLNEIAFIDTDGFDYNDGECLVRFDTVMYCPDKKLITFAVTKQGRISLLLSPVILSVGTNKGFPNIPTGMKATTGAGRLTIRLILMPR